MVPLEGPDLGVVGPVEKPGVPPDPALNRPDPGVVGPVGKPFVPPDPGLKGPDPGVPGPVGKLGPDGVLPPGDDLMGTRKEEVITEGC